MLARQILNMLARGPSTVKALHDALGPSVDFHATLRILEDSGQIVNDGGRLQLIAECDSCGEEIPKHDCPKSRRVCGHHCNHSWSHDGCCWCGAEISGDDTERKQTGVSDAEGR